MRFLMHLRVAFLLIFILTVSCSDDDNVKVIEGDVILQSQFEIDEFADKISGVTEVKIEGNLIIGSSENLGVYSDINDISRLFNITEVSGQLKFMQNPELLEVSGMSSLKKVFSINFNRNDNLKLIKFNNLRVVDDQFIIFWNKSLERLDGFDNLETIGSVDIDFNESLKSITSFTKINELSNLRITSNNQLNSISGFSNLVAIEKDLVVDSNNDLLEISDFKLLSYIGENLELKRPYFGNLNVVEISFPNLSVVGGNFNFLTNPNISVISLPKLDSVKGTISIGSTFLIDNVEYLSNLKFAGNIHISSSTIKSLSGFSLLKEIKEDLYIEYNDVLTDLNFPNLTKVSGVISVRGNSTLTLVRGLNKVRGLKSIRFENNSKLNDFCPLKNMFTSIVAAYPNTPTNFLVLIYNNAANPSYDDIVNDCN